MKTVLVSIWQSFASLLSIAPNPLYGCLPASCYAVLKVCSFSCHHVLHKLGVRSSHLVGSCMIASYKCCYPSMSSRQLRSRARSRLIAGFVQKLVAVRKNANQQILRNGVRTDRAIVMDLIGMTEKAEVTTIVSRKKSSLLVFTLAVLLEQDVGAAGY